MVNAARVAVSLRPVQANYQRPKSANYIDDFIFEKAEKLRIVPSDLTSDAEFLRRISLDMTGTLPSPDKVRRFLADRSPDKRSKLIDQLFQDPDFADFWSLKWGDQMGNTPNFLANGTGYYQWWLRKALADNVPYDEFARQLLTGLGDRYQVTPASYYPYLTNPLDRASAVAATFMGLSIDCARCHDHPREKFKRGDYLGPGGVLLAAFQQAGRARQRELSLPRYRQAVVSSRESEADDSRRDSPARARTYVRARRRSPRAPGEMADVAEQSLLREHHRESGLEAVHGPRAGGAGRFSHHQSAVASGSAEAAVPGFHPARIRSALPDEAHHDVAHVSAFGAGKRDQ